MHTGQKIWATISGLAYGTLTNSVPVPPRTNSANSAVTATRGQMAARRGRITAGLLESLPQILLTQGVQLLQWVVLAIGIP